MFTYLFSSVFSEHEGRGQDYRGAGKELSSTRGRCCGVSCGGIGAVSCGFGVVATFNPVHGLGDFFDEVGFACGIEAHPMILFCRVVTAVVCSVELIVPSRFLVSYKAVTLAARKAFLTVRVSVTISIAFFEFSAAVVFTVAVISVVRQPSGLFVTFFLKSDSIVLTLVVDVLSGRVPFHALLLVLLIVAITVRPHALRGGLPSFLILISASWQVDVFVFNAIVNRLTRVSLIIKISTNILLVVPLLCSGVVRGRRIRWRSAG